MFTGINNTSGFPITGTSASNIYQVSYEGGTGNDLTLTLVP